MTAQVVISDQADVSITITDTEVPVIVNSIIGDSVRVVFDDALGGQNSQTSITWSPLSALATWVIPHGLGRKPSVTIIDTFGSEVFAEIQHQSDDVVVADFTYPFFGSAILV